MAQPRRPIVLQATAVVINTIRDGGVCTQGGMGDLGLGRTVRSVRRCKETGGMLTYRQGMLGIVNGRVARRIIIEDEASDALYVVCLLAHQVLLTTCAYALICTHNKKAWCCSISSTRPHGAVVRRGVVSIDLTSLPHYVYTDRILHRVAHLKAAYDLVHTVSDDYEDLIPTRARLEFGWTPGATVVTGVLSSNLRGSTLLPSTMTRFAHVMCQEYETFSSGGGCVRDVIRVHWDATMSFEYIAMRLASVEGLSIVQARSVLSTGVRTTTVIATFNKFARELTGLTLSRTSWPHAATGYAIHNRRLAPSTERSAFTLDHLISDPPREWMDLLMQPNDALCMVPSQLIVWNMRAFTSVMRLTLRSLCRMTMREIYRMCTRFVPLFVTSGRNGPSGIDDKSSLSSRKTRVQCPHQP